MKFKVDVLGTYPPPIGGSSIHIERLQRRNRENGIDSVVYDTYPGSTKKDYPCIYIKSVNNYKKFLFHYFFDHRADIIHSHSHSWVERMILTMKAKLCGQKVIFTFHSLRDKKEKFGKLQTFAYNYTVKHADLFIAAGTVVEDKMLSWGISKSMIRLIMPFIAPSHEDGISLPENLEIFTNKFDYILTANASNCDHYNGDDLYGIDMSIELANYLQKRQYNFGFVFVLTKTTDVKYLSDLKERIITYELQDRFLLYEGNVDFVTLLKKTDVFVRPTNTDSWSISMSESLSLGVPCICSDVCRREDAAILFKTRDQNDFNIKVENVIKNLDFERTKLRNLIIQDNYEFVYNEYIKLVDK